MTIIQAIVNATKAAGVNEVKAISAEQNRFIARLESPDGAQVTIVFQGNIDLPTPETAALIIDQQQ